MEAVRFTRWDRRLELVNTPIPKVEHPNDVLIKIIFSGIGRKDISIINGELDCKVNEGFFLGHQISGIISSVGEDVLSFKKRDRVVVDPYTNCGICICCRSGKPHLCHEGCAQTSLGVYRNGGWAEYIVVHQTQVYKIPEGVTLEQAVITQPMSYVSHGYESIEPIHIGENILIIGSGLIGLLWIIMLHHHGHRKVIVSEPNVDRHEFIPQLGIKYEIMTPKMVSDRHSYDPQFKFDVVIDCSGSARVMEEAVSLLEYSGRLCIAGAAKTSDKVSISPYDIQRNEKMIVGVDLGPFSFHTALSHIQSLGDRYISFRQLGVKTYPIQNYKSAIEDYKNAKIIKAVFRMPDDCKCSRLAYK